MARAWWTYFKYVTHPKSGGYGATAMIFISLFVGVLVSLFTSVGNGLVAGASLLVFVVLQASLRGAYDYASGKWDGEELEWRVEDYDED